MTARRFRLFAGLVALGGLVLQYALMLGRGEFASVFAATWAYLGYFTILTNMLAAAAFLAPALAPATAPGRFFSKPTVRTAVAVYISVVALVYHFILASQWNPQGLQLVADKLLHYAVPALMVADWLLFTPKRDLSLKAAPAFLIYPVAFGAYALIRGAASGVYPYFFLDAATLGYPKVFLNLLMLTVFFGLMSVLALWGGKRLSARQAAG